MLKENKLVYLINDPEESVVQLAIKEIRDNSNYSWLTKTKYANIEYLGLEDIKNHDDIEDGLYHLINFKETSFNTVEKAQTFAMFVKSCFESNKNIRISNSKILQYIIEYFSKYSKSRQVQQIRHDVAVALFVLRCSKMGIGELALSKLKIDDNQKVYFENSNGQRLQIKFSNFLNSEIKFEDDENSSDIHENYVIVKIDFVKNELNLLSIYDEIEKTTAISDVLEFKRRSYFFDFDDEILNNESIYDYDLSLMSFYSTESLPIIKIIDPKKMKKLIYVMEPTVSDENSNDFDDSILNFFKG